ncbi:MAG: cytochrome-c peroxidase [Geminicoccaceae bacterium]
MVSGDGTKRAAPISRSAGHLLTAAILAAPIALASSTASALTPLEQQWITSLQQLGKNVFFDSKASHPSHKQACASCHDPRWGWTFPDSKINETTVVAPGAAPHALGSIKPPTNAYAFFTPPFARIPGTPFPPFFIGGNFWDGRAEGCGKIDNQIYPIGDGLVSETIRRSDLPVARQFVFDRFLGPTADQALNPFPNTVEQNIREKNVCQVVKTAKYKKLYSDAFGEDIDCSTNPKASPAYHASFTLVAVAVAAWQASPEVNSFSSKRDKGLLADPDHAFPLNQNVPAVLKIFDNDPAKLAAVNRGHDLFYRQPLPNCAGNCHNGVPSGEPADPNGNSIHQLYTDSRFHNIGIPFNREIPGVPKGEKVGLSRHVKGPIISPVIGPVDLSGMNKTPYLRNVDKRPTTASVKAFGHNGYFKSLWQIVHFYNTSRVKSDCATTIPNITDPTAEEAIAHDCWPRPEFPTALPPTNLVGDLKLSEDEENDIVAYLEALSDEETPKAP